MWGLSSPIIMSSHNSIHFPEMEINLPNMMFGCPCGGVIKKNKNGHTTSLLTLRNAFNNVRLHIYRVTTSVQLEIAITTTTMSSSSVKNGICALRKAQRSFPNSTNPVPGLPRANLPQSSETGELPTD